MAHVNVAKAITLLLMIVFDWQNTQELGENTPVRP